MSTIRAMYWNSSLLKGLTTWLLPVAISAILFLAPVFLSDFRIGLLGKFLTFAILATSLNLIWGYAGMLSLGHAYFSGWADTPWPCF